MLHTFAGRRVLVTTLDDVPRAFRAAPGVIALNPDEIAALERNDGQTFKRIIAIVQAEDARDARWQMTTPPRRKQRLRPSIRLSMLRGLNPGRKLTA